MYCHHYCYNCHYYVLLMISVAIFTTDSTQGLRSSGSGCHVGLGMLRKDVLL